MRHKRLFILLAFLPFFLFSCVEAGPSPKSSEVLPISTLVPVAIETATRTATDTKIATPTEDPLFTEAEVKAANPFDYKTLPLEFQKMEDPSYLINATDQEKQDYDAFIKAVRLDKGISKTTTGSELQNFYEAREWMDTHPEEVKGKKLEMSSLEVIALLMQKYPPVWHDKDGMTYGFDGIQIPTIPKEQYSSDNIGKILGINLNTERGPFVTVRGKLLGFAEIGGQTIILVEMKDSDGQYTVFPAVVYVEKGTTLKKGSKCMTIGGTSPVYTFTEDTEIPPLMDANGVVTWETLNNSLGNEVVLHHGIFGIVKNGTSINAFSDILNAEIAGGIDIRNKKP